MSASNASQITTLGNIANISDSDNNLNTFRDIVVLMGAIQNFILYCLFHDNMEVCKSFKFNILEFFMSKTKNKMDVETRDIPKVFVDSSLV
jgi:hypothetical protein